MAKIKGTKIAREQVEVEIPINLMWREVQSALSIGDTYLTKRYKDGVIMRMKFSYTHPHNNDDVYVEDGPATEEEIALDSAIKLISSYVSKIKE